MIEKLGEATWRTTCLTLAFLIAAQLVPGISMDITSAVVPFLVGGGLYVAYELSGVVLRRLHGIKRGTCPMPSVQRTLAIIYAVLSVAYVVALGMVFSTPLHVTNFWSALAGAAMAFAGAIFSNVLNRLFVPRKDPGEQS
jgi:hypothetical protein